MSYLNPQAIVSTEWLSRNINDPNLVVLDGTYHLPTANRNACEEFPLKHIEGAVFFNIDDIVMPITFCRICYLRMRFFRKRLERLG